MHKPPAPARPRARRASLAGGIAAVILAALGWTGLALAAQGDPPRPSPPPPVGFHISAPGVRSSRIVPGPQGTYKVHLRFNDGTEATLDGDQFLATLYRRYTHRSWVQTLLNVSGFEGVLWVLLGLSAQVLFTGRMIVQWLTSERAGRSVVPSVFWWMSLAGGAMLLVYFGWRRDIVGVIGQSTGVLIYTRNLVLLYFPRQKTPASA